MQRHAMRDALRDAALKVHAHRRDLFSSRLRYMTPSMLIAAHFGVT
jgi:hypothetical protein